MSEKWTEEEVKLKYITPAIEKAGWDRKTQIRMEYPITDGKVIVRGSKAYRSPKQRADYVLFYRDNLPLAIVEAKDNAHVFGDGLLQAQEYANKMDIRFVYTSNGDGFLEYDMKTGEQSELTLEEFRTPNFLYEKAYGEITKNKDVEKLINTPYFFGEGSLTPRYYQRVAINRAVEKVAEGRDKLLLVMATGTGKTYVAFQIIWRLMKAGLKKKILYLADRNILIDQTAIGDFKPFKGKMHKITRKEMNTSYEVYMSLYQQLSENDSEDSIAILKESFPADFFDLIVVDECHRGSARDDSRWREILNYFDSATKIGLTATPKETKEVSNIAYFGEPIYTYSLKDGIEDGFLAPYKVVRYALDSDVYGYRPKKGKTDIKGDLVEDREYSVKDFDRELVIEERTKLVAEKITDYLKSTDRFSKTIVFCIDIEHAERMAQALRHLNKDLCAENHRYITRITGDNEEGKKLLDYFIDNDSKYPTIVTSSKLMTTGVNCQTCKIIVLDNLFGENGMTEFKQIIGRGTRIKEDYDKMFFTILDFRNATRLFADLKFNGPEEPDDDFPNEKPEPRDPKEPKEPGEPKMPKEKIRVRDVDVEVISERVQYYDKDGKLITESLKDFTRRNVLKEYATIEEFLTKWTSEERRAAIKDELRQNGVLIDALRELYPANVDDFDLICDIAYGIKPLTKSERAQNAKVHEIINRYSDKCKLVLETLIEKYSNDAIDDLQDTKVLKLKEFEEIGSPVKIANLFGGKNEYLNVVREVQSALYM